MSSAVWQLVDRLANRAAQARECTQLESEVSALFAEMRAPMLRYLQTIGLSLDDGEDVVQETFLALFHHLRQDKPRDNLRGWLFRVSRNLALKRMNRNGRDPVFLGEREAALRYADRELNPEEQALQSGRHARLRAVVDALPERDRSCLFLRAEGLRYREIAEALDLSLGSVAASLGRSLSKLAIADKS